MSQFDTLLAQNALEIEAALATLLQTTPLTGPGAPPDRLIAAMRHGTLNGGKRLRPFLLSKTAAMLGTAPELTIAPAVAVQLVHCYSLIHDDLPAMDDDDLRRGRPTNHKVYGEAMAILAGDAMVTTAFELIASQTVASIAPKLVYELAHAAGAGGMIGGQVIDIASEDVSLSLDELRTLHAMKTGALLMASARMGAICAGAGDASLAAVTAFAKHVGLAFQIMDDLLDVTATPEQLGKATNKDASRGKNTYPALLGVEGSRIAADAEMKAAIDALQPLGDAANGLRALARFVVQRSS